jgi:hypothetical protein
VHSFNKVKYFPYTDNYTKGTIRRGSYCLDQWYHCHNMNRSKSILFLLIDATSTRMACRKGACPQAWDETR